MNDIKDTWYIWSFGVAILVGIVVYNLHLTPKYNTVSVRLKTTQSEYRESTIKFNTKDLPWVVFAEDETKGLFYGTSTHRCYVSQPHKGTVGVKCFTYSDVFSTNIDCGVNKSENAQEFYVGSTRFKHSISAYVYCE